MTLDEILALPLVETYELEDEPVDVDDLYELCPAFEDYRDEPDFGFVMFPVGDHDPEPYDTFEGEPVYMQTVDRVVLLQEKPIIFKVEDEGVTDYGVVQGTTLSVYRDTE